MCDQQHLDDPIGCGIGKLLPHALEGGCEAEKPGAFRPSVEDRPKSLRALGGK